MCCYKDHGGKSQTSLMMVDRTYGDHGFCLCPGQTGTEACCGYATRADGPCTRCRAHCMSPTVVTQSELGLAGGTAK